MTAIQGQSLVDLLATDHRRLDRLLAEAKCRLAAADIGRAAAEFAEFREGLERHFAAEEAVLFPALERCARSSGCEVTRILRIEHAVLQGLMEAVSQALSGASQPRHASQLPALTARIYAHNGKEERLLHPLVEQILGTMPEQTERVGRLLGLKAALGEPVPAGASSLQAG